MLERSDGNPVRINITMIEASDMIPWTFVGNYTARPRNFLPTTQELKYLTTSTHTSHDTFSGPASNHYAYMSRIELDTYPFSRRFQVITA